MALPFTVTQLFTFFVMGFQSSVTSASMRGDRMASASGMDSIAF